MHENYHFGSLATSYIWEGNMCAPNRLKIVYTSALGLLTLDILLTNGAPITTRSPSTSSSQESNRTKAQEYLKRFGYLTLPASNPQGPSSQFNIEDLMTDAVRKFQAMAGLPVTGILDKRTAEIMDRPRCGVPDYPTRQNNPNAPASFNLIGSKWGIKLISYTVSSFSSKLPREAIYDIISSALQEWSRVIPLAFYRVASQPANVTIQFVRSDHQDGFPFDGPGSVLAHAFYPTDGRVHIDDDENWTLSDRPNDGINLFRVILHEFGHTLGLDHSSDLDAVMNFGYDPYVPKWNLHTDDIAAVQELYGAPTTTTTTATTTSRPMTTTRITTPTTMRTTTTIMKTTTSRPTTPYTVPCNLTTHYLCRNRIRCIWRGWVCDGDNDCGDMSDEEQCPSTTISPCYGIDFRCANQLTCVPRAWVCDRDNDCGDMSDEQGCTSTTISPCYGNDFRCASQQKCVPRAWVCDHYNDCGDMSDEQGCTTQAQTTARTSTRTTTRTTTTEVTTARPPSGVSLIPCPADSIPCQNMPRCIRRVWVCDGYNDCGNWSDETNCG